MSTNTSLKKNIGFFCIAFTCYGIGYWRRCLLQSFKCNGSDRFNEYGTFVWLLGGIMTICAGLTGAELAAAIPETGGLTKYIEYTYGDFGVLSGWAQAFIYFPANIAALAIILERKSLIYFIYRQHCYFPLQS